MADVREKLAELIHDARMNALWHNPQNPDAYIADMIIPYGVTIQRWIPVTERLPEEFVSVLGFAPGLAPLPTVHEMYRARGCWVIPGVEILEGHEVTHWMEMPAGPGDCHGDCSASQ